MENKINLNDGSFRDPCSRVYELHEQNSKNIRIIRGPDKQSLNNFTAKPNSDGSYTINFSNDAICFHLLLK